MARKRPLPVATGASSILRYMKKRKTDFEEEHSEFLVEIGLISAHLEHSTSGVAKYETRRSENCVGFRQKINLLDSDSVSTTEKLKLLDFKVAFENPEEFALTTECFLFYDCSATNPIKIFLQEEDEETFKSERYIIIDEKSPVASTSTFGDFMLFAAKCLDNDPSTRAQQSEFLLPFEMCFSVPKQRRKSIGKHMNMIKNGHFDVSIYITAAEVHQRVHSELFSSQRNSLTQKLTLFAFGLHRHFLPREGNSQEPIPLDDIYKGVHAIQLKKLANVDLTKPANLVPDLKSFQANAVQWLVNQEISGRPGHFEFLFQKAKFPDGEVLYIHKVYGFVVTPEAFKNYVDSLPALNGGILADEMGSGKTIEMISLILTHSNMDPFFYPKSWPKDGAKVASPATLILCPKNLIQHWTNELNKHSPNLDVLVYEGPNKNDVKHPMQLAKRDVVLTTYDVLEKEIRYKKKRLLAIKWHRICIDEAQSVTLAKATIIRQNIRSTYRWAITGTPMKTFPTDMENLFELINEKPLKRSLFQKILSLDTESSDEQRSLCFQMIADYLWRTPKALAQSGSDLKPPIVRLYITKRLLTCLMRTKAECEPKKAPTKFSTLIKDRITREKRLAICDLSKWVESMNYASLSMIRQQRFEDAVLNYRKINKCLIKIGKEDGEEYKLDLAQLYQIYYNYGRVLSLLGCAQINDVGIEINHAIEPLNCDGLALENQRADNGFKFQDGEKLCVAKAISFYDSYLLESKTILHGVFESILKTNDPMVIEQRSILKLDWIDLSLIFLVGKEPTLDHSIILPDDLTSPILGKISTPTGLINESKRIVEKFKRKYAKCMAFVDDFDEKDFTGEDFYQFYDCHIVQSSGDPVPCVLCKGIRKIDKMNSMLGLGKSVFKNWRKSPIFQILLKLVGYWTSYFPSSYKTHSDYQLIVEESKLFFEWMEAMMIDFQSLYRLFNCLKDATLRHNKFLQATQLENNGDDDMLDKDMILKRFEKARKRINYLKKISEPNGDCLYCTEKIEKFSVLKCGHLYCLGCLKKIRAAAMAVRRKTANHEIKCAFCREKTLVLNVIFDRNEIVPENLEPESSFIYIASKLQEIAGRNDKVLVFGSQMDVLQNLEAFLNRNFVMSSLVTNAETLGDRLDLFRNSNGCKVLLMPFSLAARGWYLPEANHVFFVGTPAMEDEQQAIYKVHNLGQFRPTYIHRILNTVDEIVKYTEENEQNLEIILS